MLNPQSRATDFIVLESVGAIHEPGRYVIDRNRATGGGVTTGIDFGLAVIAEIVDEETAKVVQLAMEYAPQPPFNCGTPNDAPPEIVQKTLQSFGVE